MLHRGAAGRQKCLLRHRSVEIGEKTRIDVANRQMERRFSAHFLGDQLKEGFHENSRTREACG
jgi:hypothetical protein